MQIQLWDKDIWTKDSALHSEVKLLVASFVKTGRGKTPYGCGGLIMDSERACLARVTIITIMFDNVFITNQIRYSFSQPPPCTTMYGVLPRTVVLKASGLGVLLLPDCVPLTDRSGCPASRILQAVSSTRGVLHIYPYPATLTNLQSRPEADGRRNRAVLLAYNRIRIRLMTDRMAQVSYHCLPCSGSRIAVVECCPAVQRQHRSVTSIPVGHQGSFIPSQWNCLCSHEMDGVLQLILAELCPASPCVL